MREYILRHFISLLKQRTRQTGDKKNTCDEGSGETWIASSSRSRRQSIHVASDYVTTHLRRHVRPASKYRLDAASVSPAAEAAAADVSLSMVRCTPPTLFSVTWLMSVRVTIICTDSL